MVRHLLAVLCLSVSAHGLGVLLPERGATPQVPHPSSPPQPPPPRLPPPPPLPGRAQMPPHTTCPLRRRLPSRCCSRPRRAPRAMLRRPCCARRTRSSRRGRRPTTMAHVRCPSQQPRRAAQRAAHGWHPRPQHTSRTTRTTCRRTRRRTSTGPTSSRSCGTETRTAKARV